MVPHLVLKGPVLKGIREIWNTVAITLWWQFPGSPQSISTWLPTFIQSDSRAKATDSTTAQAILYQVAVVLVLVMWLRLVPLEDWRASGDYVGLHFIHV